MTPRRSRPWAAASSRPLRPAEAGRRSRLRDTPGARSRIAATLAAAVLTVTGGAAFATPAFATPEPTGDCTTTSGVIVAVDFGHWDGPILRSCGSTPTTGYDLLNQGGWHTAGTVHDGPGFVCRIGYAGYRGGAEYPTAQQDPCVLTPPASAYWTFWQAGPGQNTWSYSSVGALNERPAPGGVELWLFGGTNSGDTSGSGVPTFRPSSVRALNTSPAGTVRKPALKHETSRPTQGASPAASRTTPTSARPSGAAAVASSAAPTVRDAQPTVASAAQVSHGSATPAIIALVIVLLLAAAGITAVLRRPRRER
jgi:hypothetical protein